VLSFTSYFNPMYQEAGVTVPDILHLGPSSFIRECNKVKKIFVLYAVLELHHLYQNCFMQNVFVAEDPIIKVSSLSFVTIRTKYTNNFNKVN